MHKQGLIGFWNWVLWLLKGWNENGLKCQHLHEKWQRECHKGQHGLWSCSIFECALITEHEDAWKERIQRVTPKNVGIKFSMAVKWKLEDTYEIWRWWWRQ